MEQDNESGLVRIPLDGTFGAGPDAEITIVTKTEDGKQRESIYTVPYLCLNLERIQRLCDMNLILGYRIVKGDSRPTGLKELGL
jgi:hypothetical protein